jgi:hypothetical protein
MQRVGTYGGRLLEPGEVIRNRRAAGGLVDCLQKRPPSERGYQLMHPALRVDRCRLGNDLVTDCLRKIREVLVTLNG